MLSSRYAPARLIPAGWEKSSIATSDLQGAPQRTITSL
jgi:hypothetical protein